MQSRQRFRRRSFASTLGVVLGVVAGVGAATWSVAGARPASTEPQAVFDATHLPPLLTAPNESIDLAYDVHCAAAEDESADAGCDAGGTVFVRTIGGTLFSPLPLESRVEGGVRQLAVVVPDRFHGTRGIEYYAELEAAKIGREVTLPAGGAAAPHVSRPLLDSVTVDLGRHVFEGNRRDGARVAFASWGDRPGQAGLENGRNLGPIGASAFDVDSDGSVFLLDQVHRCVLRWGEGSKLPASVPVSVNGTLADMSVADDGSIYVLETTAPPGRRPLVRRFDDGGRELEAVETAERTSSQIRIENGSPVVLGRPSHHWTPIVVDGVPASPTRQLERGRPGRRFGGGLEVVATRDGTEIRVAVVAGRAVTRSWRVTSATPFAEVQLAEPSGQRVVLVARVYDDTADEFVVLVLARNGLVDRFALDSMDWAEASALGRFRLLGRSLYRLGSSPSGVFVDRYDLEVR
jgi:hypothetical protein